MSQVKDFFAKFVKRELKNVFTIKIAMSIVITALYVTYHMTVGKSRVDTSTQEWVEKQNGPSHILAQVFGVDLVKEKGYGGLVFHAILMFLCLSIIEFRIGPVRMLLSLLLAAFVSLSISNIERNVRYPKFEVGGLYRERCCGSHFYFQLVGAALVALFAGGEGYRKIVYGLMLPIVYTGTVLYDKYGKGYKKSNEKNKYFPFLWHSLAYAVGVVWGGLVMKKCD